jgi:hypothetical protein
MSTALASGDYALAGRPKRPGGAPDGEPGDAGRGRDLGVGGQFAAEADGVEDGVGGPDPGPGVVATGADGHHDSRAQMIRSPSPVTCTPQPAGPVSASTTLSPWGRSSVWRLPRHGPPASRHSTLT